MGADEGGGARLGLWLRLWKPCEGGMSGRVHGTEVELFRCGSSRWLVVSRCMFCARTSTTAEERARGGERLSRILNDLLDVGRLHHEFN
jgi:hypothetical protein